MYAIRSVLHPCSACSGYQYHHIVLPDNLGDGRAAALAAYISSSNQGLPKRSFLVPKFLLYRQLLSGKCLSFGRQRGVVAVLAFPLSSKRVAGGSTLLREVRSYPSLSDHEF